MTRDQFENIVLNRKEVETLKRISGGKWHELDKREAKTLVHSGLIKNHVIAYDNIGNPVTDSFYSITDDGLRYLDYHRKKWIDKFLSDLRGWITTIIAVAALLKSFWPDISRLIFGR